MVEKMLVLMIENVVIGVVHVNKRELALEWRNHDAAKRTIHEVEVLS